MHRVHTLLASAALFAFAGCSPPVNNPDGGNSDSGNRDVVYTSEDGTVIDTTNPTGTWTTVNSGTTADIHVVWGSGPSDVYATVSRSLLHYTGSSWTAASSDYVLSSVAGTGANDAWVLAITIPPAGSSEMGHLVFQHNTGGGFMDMMPTIPATLGFMHFAAPDNGWAVGVLNSAAHWDGAAWTSAQSGLTNTNLTGVFTIGPTDAVAVGDHIWRWNGTDWTMQPTVRTEQQHNFNAVWAFSANDIWLVGQYAYIQHWNGSAWEDSYPGDDPGGYPISTDLFAVWGAAPNDIWAVGDGGTIIHYNGVEWIRMAGGGGPSPTMNGLHGVWGSSANDVWAVGDRGTILHYH